MNHSSIGFVEVTKMQKQMVIQVMMDKIEVSSQAPKTSCESCRHGQVTKPAKADVAASGVRDLDDMSSRP